jgi:hypothetical protein
LSENKIRPPIKVLDAEIHFLNAAHILVDTLHRIPGRLMFGAGDASEDVFVRFLIDRARGALRALDHEALTGIDIELKRVKAYLDSAEKYLNERQSI